MVHVYRQSPENIPPSRMLKHEFEESSYNYAQRYYSGGERKRGNQYRTRIDLGLFSCGLRTDVVFGGALEQPARGALEAAESGFLQPIGDRVKQKRSPDTDRRFVAIERAPKLLEGGEVEVVEFGELVRQALIP